MGVINIRALFDWKDIQTGLQNMKGQFQRVGAEVDKGFSVGSLARNFLGGFVGVNLAAKLVEPFRMAADYAKRLSDHVADLRSASLAGLLERNGPERQVATLEGEMRGNESRQAEVRAQLRELPNFAEAVDDPALFVARNPEVANPFVFDALKGQYDALIEEQQALEKTQQELKNRRDALKRQLRDGERRSRAAAAAAADTLDVAQGRTTQAEALTRAAERARQEAAAVLKLRGPGLEAAEAATAATAAEAAAEAARIQEAKTRRGQGYEAAGIQDQAAVESGGLTSTAAAERAAERARSELATLYAQGRSAAEIADAENRLSAAEAAAARTRTEEAKTRRGQGYERATLLDEREVQAGRMSGYEAAQADVARARAERDLLRSQGRSSIEIADADNRLLSAENRLAPLQAAAERERVNGVLPQISSSTLAQLGGGGNVNVFGGRPGEGVSELREHTRLLRQIAMRVGGSTLTSTDVGP